MAKDDFVVDDGVEGYLDNGMDDWENVGAQEDSEDEPMYRSSTPLYLPLTLLPLNLRLHDDQS